jgi:hypothetical protein
VVWGEEVFVGVFMFHPPAPTTLEKCAASPAVLVPFATTTLTVLCGTVVVGLLAGVW